MTTDLTTTDYTDESFWQKVKKYARKAGEEVIGKALQLYYAAQNPDTPAWAKTVIYGALAYFIMPLDAIPDTLPVVGFTDDLGALAAALYTVNSYITPEVIEQAKAKLRDWFGE